MICIKKAIFQLFILCFVCFSCRFQNNYDNFIDNSKNKINTITFMTWNTQTFFDGITDGYEFSEFKKSDCWDNNKYKTRLSRLCHVITDINPDIILLEEIENEDIIQDISNMIAGNSWNKNKIWSYGAFSKSEKSPFGCGILSRYPINSITTHNMNIITEYSPQPSMRPIMEILIDINNKPLIIFANHWKSKSGGAEQSEKWRLWQENILCQCIKNIEKKGYKYCIASGDFNKDISEFQLSTEENSNNIILNNKAPTSFSKSEKVKLYSPWLSEELKRQPVGSYYYKDNWERIDHIFAWGDISITNFTPVAKEPWTDLKSIPIRYSCFTGKGYSDHLPLTCTLSF